MCFSYDPDKKEENMKTLKQKTRLLLSILAIILCSILPGQVYAADTNPPAAPISDGLSLQDDRYVLYVKGTQVRSPGWQTLPEQKFQIGPDGGDQRDLEGIQLQCRYHRLGPL